jgi:hypothetical protein
MQGKYHEVASDRMLMIVGSRQNGRGLFKNDLLLSNLSEIAPNVTRHINFNEHFFFKFRSKSELYLNATFERHALASTGCLPLILDPRTFKIITRQFSVAVML